MFCPTCGSPVAYRGERWPDEIHFFVGLFDDAAALAPKAHVYTCDELPWLADYGTLRRFERTPSEDKSK
jgi:hypothetical protein